MPMTAHRRVPSMSALCAHDSAGTVSSGGNAHVVSIRRFGGGGGGGGVISSITTAGALSPSLPQQKHEQDARAYDEEAGGKAVYSSRETWNSQSVESHCKWKGILCVAATTVLLFAATNALPINTSLYRMTAAANTSRKLASSREPYPHDQRVRYSIVLDAGSTGTRAYVFRYRLEDSDGSNSYIHMEEVRIEDKIRSGDENAYFRVESRPGLDSLAKAEVPKNLSMLMLPLYEYAVSAVPEELWMSTPIVLLATGGLRKLGISNPHAQSKILFQVNQELKNWKQSRRLSDNGYAKEPLGDGHEAGITIARIISGEEEAAFAFLAVNLQRNQLDGIHWGEYQSKFSSSIHNVAVSDLGGSSLEVAFVAGDECTEATPVIRLIAQASSRNADSSSCTIDSHPNSRRSEPVYQITQSNGYVRIPLYHRSDADAASRQFDCVKSWSSSLLGMNEAFERSVQMIYGESSQNSLSLQHPCMHPGSPVPYSSATLGELKLRSSGYLNGKERILACRNLANHVVVSANLTAVRKKAEEMTLVGLSGYYVIADFFGLISEGITYQAVSLHSLLKTVESHCNLSWNTVKELYGNRQNFDRYCFRGFFLLSILKNSPIDLGQEGLQILADPGASWTSGAAALMAVETHLCQPASLFFSQAWVTDFSPSVLTFGFLTAFATICVLALRSLNSNSSSSISSSSSSNSIIMIHAKAIRDRRKSAT